MKIAKSIVLVTLCCFFSRNIFSQSGVILNYLPDDAKMVMKINPASLGQKIKWEDLLKYPMFADALKDIPEDRRDYLNNPEHTGIDLGKGFYVVASENKDHSSVLYGFPKDTALFSAMVMKLLPGKQVTKIGNGRLIIDNKTALAWNRDVFVVTSYDSAKNSVQQNPGEKMPTPDRVTQLTKRCQALLSKRKDAFHKEHFSPVLSDNGDILFWSYNSPSALSKKNNKMAGLSMLGKSFMQKGNTMSGVINFENGKVVMNLKQYIPATLDSIYMKYPVKNINTDLIKKLPPGHTIAIFDFSFSPEMMADEYAKAGADKILDSISKHKVQLQNILPAIKGDFMLAVVKADSVDVEDSATKSMGGMQVFLAGGIRDAAKFQDLQSLFQNEKGDSTKSNPGKKTKPFLRSNNSVFVVSLSPVAAQKYLDSPGDNDEAEKPAQPYLDHPSLFIVDLRTVFGLVLPSLAKGKSEEQNKQAAEVLGMFDKLVAYGDGRGNGSISSTMEITLTDKDDNSLKQFLNLLNLVHSLKKKKPVAYNDKVPVH